MPDNYELEELQSIQQNSTPAPYNPATPLPWWKRKLLAMQTQGAGPMPQQPVEGGGGSPVDQWNSLGKGVNNLAMKFIGMEHGGAVQGPTMAMIGEGGEPEYVVPESKVAPWVSQIQQTGAIPNPADLSRDKSHDNYMPPPPVILPPQANERTGNRPPPPVILPPRMCDGGKVMPKMAQGGVVYPRTVESVMPENTDYFNVGGEMGPYAEPVTFSGAPLPQPPTARRPMPQMPLDARKAYWQMKQQAPIPKWYERALGAGNENAGGGQLDMRPGVAPYSTAGRAAGNVLRGILPFNRKRDEYNRNLAGAEAAARMEETQQTQGEKQYRMGIEADQADSRMARDRAAQATSERQLEKLNAPESVKTESRDYTNSETGDVTRVTYNTADGKEISRNVLPGVAKPKPSAPQNPQQPTAASLARDAADPTKPPEARKAAADALKLMKPPRPTGGDSGAMSKDEFSRMSRLTGGYKGEKAISILPEIRNGVEAMREAAARGSSVDDITLMRLFSKITDPTTGVREEEYRTMAGAQGIIDKVNLFASGKWTQGEQLTPEMRKKFVEVGNRIYENRKKQAREIAGKYSKQATAAGVDPSLIVDDFGDDAPVKQVAAPIVQRNKTTGAFRHSLDGGKTWQPGQPK